MTGELWEIISLFARLSFFAFGGGIAVIPEIKREAVANGWVTEREFVEIFALGQITPGPGLLITLVIGYHVAGLPGALAAGLAVFLPSSLLAWVVTWRWSLLRDSPLVHAIREGMGPVAIGLLATGGYTLGRTAVDGALTAVIALAVTVSLLRFRISPGVPVLLSGLAGWLLFR